MRLVDTRHPELACCRLARAPWQRDDEIGLRVRTQLLGDRRGRSGWAARGYRCGRGAGVAKLA